MTRIQTADVAVLIGRFQPFHNGHMRLLRKALETAPQVFIVLGSAFHARNPKNPWSWQERASMISACLPESERERLTFIPVRDYHDDRRWLKVVRDEVEKRVPADTHIALIGHFKDASSSYLEWFGNWTRIEMPQEIKIDATELRLKLFRSGQGAKKQARLCTVTSAVVAGLVFLLSALVLNAHLRTHQPLASDFLPLLWLILTAAGLYKIWQTKLAATLETYARARGLRRAVRQVSARVPEAIGRQLRDWIKRSVFTELTAEQAFLDHYRHLWRNAPYPPIFNTVDAVVQVQDRVLLIRRGNYPGKGLLALPGGFVEQEETLLQSAVRELSEETGFALPEALLMASLEDSAIFDYPWRSLRGRTITQAFYFTPDVATPPPIEAADDAAAAMWIAISDLPGLEDQFHDDHYLILTHFLHGD